MNLLHTKVPVIFLGFNRPDLAVRTLASIREDQPSHLYVVLDGPRPDRPSDMERCKAMRDLVEATIDWDCDVIRDYSDKNMGCSKRVSSGITSAFQRYESAIILEDDLVIDPSFYSLCEYGLTEYRDAKQVIAITGNNFQKQKRGTGSYYFSKFPHCWGWATWRRAWELFDYSMTPPAHRSDRSVIANYHCSESEQEYWLARFEDTRCHRVDSWAFRWLYSCWRNQGLAVTPNANLVQNIGFHDYSTHTIWNDQLRDHPHSIPAKSIELPIVRPSSIKQDVDADEYTFNSIFYPPINPQVAPASRIRSLVQKLTNLIRFKNHCST